ncbi:MAG: TrkA family potassium uptake protein [Candidatus Tectimicrobiota bacterium]
MQFIVIGCGRVGTGLTRDLTQRGHDVTVVDKDPAAFTRLGSRGTVQRVTGTCFDREVLGQAGIGHADGLAAVTGSDETNLVVARLARLVFRVPRVVARLYEPRKAEVYRQLGVETITPLVWGIQRLAELLCYSRLHTVLSLGSGAVDLVEVELPVLLVGRTVSEVTLSGEIQVAAISRGGRTWLPTLGTVLQEGDVLHLVVLATSMERLKTLLA